MSVSLAVDRVKTVQVLEPRTNITNERVYSVANGPQESTWQPVTSTSYANNSIQWSVNPPAGVIVDRKVYMQIAIALHFTFTGPVVGPPLQFGTNDGLRAFPLDHLIQTLQVQLNNNSASIQSSEVVPYLARCMKGQEIDFSMTPAQLDSFQNYSDWLQPWGGDARNPLAPYGANDRDVTTRGAFSYNFIPGATYGTGIQIVSNVAGALTADIVVYLLEPVFLSPFYAGKGNAAGFFGLNTMQFNLTLNNFDQLWSHSAAGNTLVLTGANKISGSIGAPSSFQPAVGVPPPRLLVNFLTPLDISRLPKSVSYEYEEIQRFNTDFNAPLANGVAAVGSVSNNLILQSMPKKFYIFVPFTLSSRTALTPDCMAVINRISVNINNRTGLFASATMQDLYDMSVRNGSNQTWLDFSQYAGSIIIIDPAADIGLGPDLAPGTVGSVNFQVSVDYSNSNPKNNGLWLNPSIGTNYPGSTVYAADPINQLFSIYIITISDGIFTLADGRAVSSTAVLTPADVLHAKSSAPQVAYNVWEENAIMAGGGNFYGDVKRFLGNAVKSLPGLLRKGYSKVRGHGGAVSVLSSGPKNLASALGMGRTGGRRRHARRRMRGRGGLESGSDDDDDDEEKSGEEQCDSGDDECERGTNAGREEPRHSSRSVRSLSELCSGAR